MKKKTAFQKALEEEEGSGGSGNTTTANRPKSREKKVTGTGKPITMGRKTASTFPGWDEYTKKTATSAAQPKKKEDIKPRKRKGNGGR